MMQKEMSNIFSLNVILNCRVPKHYSQRSSIAAGGEIAFRPLVTDAWLCYFLMLRTVAWLYSSSWNKSTKVLLQMRFKMSAPLAAILLL